MMKRYILFPLLLALPLSIAAQGTIRRPSKPKVENSKPKPKPSPRTQTTPKPKPTPTVNRQTELNKLVNNMVYVSGGTFIMGATSEQGSDAESNEKPAHSVTLSSFYICKYEVTQSLWRAVMGQNPSRFKGNNLPVDNVSWNDCQTFIARLNNLTGKKFRLPTEAEWEYAARGGNRSCGYKYSGSDTPSEVAWYRGICDDKTHPVGSKNSNELGLYDMSGNVWEWCSDIYGFYSSSSLTDPTGPSKALGGSRVRRGGSWGGNESVSRLSCRCGNAPDTNGSYFGLRLAISQL